MWSCVSVQVTPKCRQPFPVGWGDPAASPFPPSKYWFPFLVLWVPWTILWDKWVGIMGRKKERLTGSEWFSNLTCIKITWRACLNTICFSPLLISLGLLWGPGTCISTSSQVMLMLLVWLPYFENHWLEAWVQLQKKISSGVTVWGVLWSTTDSYHSPLSTPSPTTTTHVHLSLEGVQM